MGTVGRKDAVGAAIIALGVFLFIAPFGADKVASLASVPNDTLSILSGSVLVLSTLTVLAGLAVLLGIREAPEEE